MAVRLLHVPTIVSLRQLELDSSASAGGGAWSSHPTPSENTPIASASGASLPLYMYPAGGTMAKAPRRPAANEVPDFFQPGTAHAWDLALDQHLSGQEGKPGRTLGKNCNQNDDSDMRDDDRSQTDNNNLLAMVVPVCTSHQTSAAKPIPTTTTSPWSSPFITDSPEGSEALGRSLTAFDDNDMLSDSSSMSPSMSPSMESSPRPSSNGSKRGVVAVRSTLDTLITALWDDCDARGLFRYNVSKCATRVVPSKLGWIAQLNEGRMSKKRPTELKVDAVLQPFDNNKFNFGRAFLKEVLLEFEPLPAARDGAGAAMQRAWAASNTGAQVIESYGMPSDPTLVMINVSPIDYGHVLLVPHVLDQRPQQLEVEGVSAALAFTREVANPTFRLGYNSLGAYATINHLHFQGYYLSQRLPCEKASTQPLRDFDHPAILVSQLTDYPVRGWVVEVRHGLEPLACEGDLAAVIMQICGQLQSMDQPFNVMLVEQGTRVFIWPQCYAERQAKGEVEEELLETGVNPAVFEVAGHLVLKRAEDYTEACDVWACRLLAGVSLTQDRFEQLTRLCLGCECGPVSRRGSLGAGCGREAMNCGLAWELETAFQWCTDR